MTDEQKKALQKTLIAEHRLTTMAQGKLDKLWEIADEWYEDVRLAHSPRAEEITYTHIVKRLVTFGRVF